MQLPTPELEQIPNYSPLLFRYRNLLMNGKKPSTTDSGKICEVRVTDHGIVLSALHDDPQKSIHALLPYDAIFEALHALIDDPSNTK